MKSAGKIQREKSKAKERLYAVAIVVAVAFIAWGVFLLLGEMSKKAADQQVNEESVQTESEPEDEVENDGELGSEENLGTTDDKLPVSSSDQTADPSIDAESGFKIAEVIINYVGIQDGKVSVSGSITNMVENGGRCVYKFINTSGQTIEQASSVLPSPSSMPCGEVSLDKTEFSKGKWSVVLQYQSNNAKGESEKYEFTID